MKYGCKIESLGVYVPDQVMSTQSIVDRLKIPVPLKLELLTGISERRVCSEDEDSLILAEKAVLDCLKHSKYVPGDIEMIIYCSISRYVNGLRHVYEPAISVLLQEKLGCVRSICFDITNACAGMLTGIHIASDFIERGVVENCLVVSGEYITSLTQNAIDNIRSPLSPEIASLTIGDAGGAVILSRSDSKEESIIASRFITLGEYSDLCMAFQSPWQEGGIMETQMKAIHKASISHAPIIIEQALSEAGLTIDQIDYLIPHQTARQAIREGKDHFTSYFGKMAKNVVQNLEKVGNTASTSHTLALYELLKENRLERGSRVMLLGFASGLIIGVIIFTIHDLADRYGSNH